MPKLLWRCAPTKEDYIRTKFEENYLNHFWDTNEQTSVFYFCDIFFLLFAQAKKSLQLTNALLNLAENLHTYKESKGNNQYQFWCRFIQDCRSYSWLFLQRKINLLTSLQGKPLAWATWKSNYIGRFNIVVERNRTKKRDLCALFDTSMKLST